MSTVRLALGALGIFSTLLLTACVAQTQEPVWCKLPEEPRSDQFAPPLLLPQDMQSSRLPDFNGTVIVEQCVDESGHLEHAPRVVDSSHIPAVDAAAVRYASQQQFLPARRAGQAVASCCLATIGMAMSEAPRH